ncbi:beta-1 adrenergic receptor-like [Stylophora pistillata]|uniref:beta-1 adrenergic receptor-like n=1 Tax=Stylophora pistillata TaxID=50429 RepID=UPI000C0409B4|nr:beta-1 adrenergic receptor-like [Stylophora pistillata]
MNESHPKEHLSGAASIILSLWFFFSGLAAVTGNAAVLWLFYKNQSFRTISNRHLASLSVADFSVGLIVDPLWIVIRCWIKPRAETGLYDSIEVLWVYTTATTTFNICCVSVDRFIAIRFPFRHQDIVTKKRCYTVITLVWSVSLGLSISMLLQNDENVKKFFLLLPSIIFVFPLLVVSFCYISIFRVARKQFKTMLARESSQNCDENIRVSLFLQNFKAIKTVGFVVGACIITWMPSLALYIVSCYHILVTDQYETFESLLYVAWPWAEAIAFTSSAMNPMIYYFRNSEFRQVFRRTFQRLSSLDVNNSPDIDLKRERNRTYEMDGRVGI